MSVTADKLTFRERGIGADQPVHGNYNADIVREETHFQGVSLSRITPQMRTESKANTYTFLDPYVVRNDRVYAVIKSNGAKTSFQYVTYEMRNNVEKYFLLINAFPELAQARSSWGYNRVYYFIISDLYLKSKWQLTEFDKEKVHAIYRKRNVGSGVTDLYDGIIDKINDESVLMNRYLFLGEPASLIQKQTVITLPYDYVVSSDIEWSTKNLQKVNGELVLKLNQRFVEPKLKTFNNDQVALTCQGYTVTFPTEIENYSGSIFTLYLYGGAGGGRKIIIQYINNQEVNVLEERRVMGTEKEMLWLPQGIELNFEYEVCIEAQQDEYPFFARAGNTLVIKDGGKNEEHHCNLIQKLFQRDKWQSIEAKRFLMKRMMEYKEEDFTEVTHCVLKCYLKSKINKWKDRKAMQKKLLQQPADMNLFILRKGHDILLAQYSKVGLLHKEDIKPWDGLYSHITFGEFDEPHRLDGQLVPVRIQDGELHWVQRAGENGDKNGFFQPHNVHVGLKEIQDERTIRVTKYNDDDGYGSELSYNCMLFEDCKDGSLYVSTDGGCFAQRILDNKKTMSGILESYGAPLEVCNEKISYVNWEMNTTSNRKKKGFKLACDPTVWELCKGEIVNPDLSELPRQKRNLITAILRCQSVKIRLHVLRLVIQSQTFQFNISLADEGFVELSLSKSISRSKEYKYVSMDGTCVENPGWDDDIFTGCIKVDANAFIKRKVPIGYKGIFDSKSKFIGEMHFQWYPFIPFVDKENLKGPDKVIYDLGYTFREDLKENGFHILEKEQEDRLRIDMRLLDKLINICGLKLNLKSPLHVIYSGNEVRIIQRISVSGIQNSKQTFSSYKQMGEEIMQYSDDKIRFAFRENESLGKELIKCKANIKC